MTPCDRFEREGLLRLERGQPLDGHFSTCPDCLEARAAYERLGRQIAGAGLDHRPPPRWQAEVWTAVERRQARRRPRWVWAAVPAGLAAAAAVAFLLLAPPPPIALTVAVAAGGGAVHRGEDAHPGDVLTLRATTGGARHAELRLYRNEAELLLRCSTAPPCSRRGDVLEASFELLSIGSYQPLLLLSDQPLPDPAAGLDADAGDALAAGARVELGREIDVR